MMRHPSYGQMHIDAFTGISSAEADMINRVAPAYDFWDHPSAESFREFLIEGLNDEIAGAAASAKIHAEDIQADAQDAVSPSDGLFEFPFTLTDVLEKVEALREDQILVLFGYLLGQHYGIVE